MKHFNTFPLSSCWFCWLILQCFVYIVCLTLVFNASLWNILPLLNSNTHYMSGAICADKTLHYYCNLIQIMIFFLNLIKTLAKPLQCILKHKNTVQSAKKKVLMNDDKNCITQQQITSHVRTEMNKQIFQNMKTKSFKTD